jgi:hypothetical protein
LSRTWRSRQAASSIPDRWPPSASSICSPPTARGWTPRQASPARPAATVMDRLARVALTVLRHELLGRRRSGVGPHAPAGVAMSHRRTPRLRPADSAPRAPRRRRQRPHPHRPAPRAPPARNISRATGLTPGCSPFTAVLLFRPRINSRSSSPSHLAQVLRARGARGDASSAGSDVI